ncbi:MAG TPA: hypothetical protein VL360_08085 [Gammaproteobacteria bacterium]|jgi:hypothetical protein|nr:hypothetical protein [Gammaproteobacteria bacterium]
MKKENVINLAEYKAKIRQQSQHNDPDNSRPALVISDELKSAIEHLIVKLRAQEPSK